MATTEGIGGFVSVATGVPATYNTTGYAALTWVEVSELSEVPEFGAEYAENSFTTLKTGIKNKFHGELDYGSVSLTMALDIDDAGQIILNAALVSKDEINFCITRSDGNGDYISGKVFSFKKGMSIGSVVPATSMVGFTKANVPFTA